jgi:hypothetical protein
VSGIARYWKPALIGILLALAVVGIALWFVLQAPAAPARASTQRVFVVLGAPAEDGSMLAQLITVDRPGSLTDISPRTTVDVEDISADHAEDLFVFNGAAGIASALSSQVGATNPAWVELDPAQWKRLVDRDGGVTVTVPASVNVFNGRRLVRIRAGAQKLGSEEISALFVGVKYLSAADQTQARIGLEQAIAQRLASLNAGTADVQTNIDRADLGTWLSRLSDDARSATSTVLR